METPFGFCELCKVKPRDPGQIMSERAKMCPDCFDVEYPRIDPSVCAQCFSVDYCPGQGHARITRRGICRYTYIVEGIDHGFYVTEDNECVSCTDRNIQGRCIRFCDSYRYTELRPDGTCVNCTELPQPYARGYSEVVEPSDDNSPAYRGQPSESLTSSSDSDTTSDGEEFERPASKNRESISVEPVLRDGSKRNIEQTDRVTSPKRVKRSFFQMSSTEEDDNPIDTTVLVDSDDDDDDAADDILDKTELVYDDEDEQDNVNHNDAPVEPAEDAKDLVGESMPDLFEVQADDDKDSTRASAL